MDIHTVCNFLCGNCIIVLACFVILILIIISLASGKSRENEKLDARMHDLIYEIERIRKENRELKKNPYKSLKEDIQEIMVTGKTVRGGNE